MQKKRKEDQANMLNSHYDMSNQEDLWNLAAETTEMIDFINKTGIQDNKAQMMRLAEINGMAVMVASERLRDDEELMIAAIRNTGIAFQFASERIRNMKNVAELAIYSWPVAYDWLGDDLKMDTDLARGLGDVYKRQEND